MNRKELIEKFKSEIEKADWEALKTHHERDALFLVDGSLDLYEVGVSIALDDVLSVKSWMDADLIRKPKEEEVSLWEGDQYRFLGSFLIIQPYVILQLGD